MYFDSIEFLVFFAVVFAVYWAVPFQKLKVFLLLAASYYFYISWNAKLAAVVAGSSLVDFFLGQALENSTGTGRRKAFLIASIVMNLGLLFYFKYSNFFLQSLGDLLRVAGMQAQMPVLDLLAPIGISFYTFEAISYMVDVYTKRTQAEKNPIHFLLFISFFPRMVAGPIIRARNFLPQVTRRKRFSWARLRLGFEYVLMGLFKKTMIADRMASLSDPVFDSPQKYCTSAAWLAVVAYALQIYCDFSGYSDIAIGTAHMLGFKLPRNFNMPYLSRNIAEFWRRWHISLSTWLRDYVFISLGGSRGSLMRTAFTLMGTFALCGLWHGARWTFVAFGIVHGLMMVVHRFFQTFCGTRPGLNAFLRTKAGTVLCAVVTFFCVAFGWVFFRSQDFATVSAFFYQLFTPQRGPMVRGPVGAWGLVFSLGIIAVSHAVAQSGSWKKIAMRFSPPAWGLGCSMLVVLFFLARSEAQRAFIYFQF